MKRLDQNFNRGTVISAVDLRDRWENIRISDLSFASSEVYDRVILPCYLESHRFYHNIYHIERSFDLFDTNLPSSLIREADTISLALFFHDVCYVPERTDNEEKSAELFHSLVPVSDDLSKRVRSMILATKSHETDDPSTQFLIDLDLSILGSDESEYIQYMTSIRQEYSFIPDHIYNKKRMQVLYSFLEKSRIFFFTPYFETPARRNLQMEIEILRRGEL